MGEFEAIRSEWNQEGVEFLITDLDLALTFLDMAQSFQEGKKEIVNRNLKKTPGRHTIPFCASLSLSELSGIESSALFGILFEYARRVGTAFRRGPEAGA